METQKIKHCSKCGRDLPLSEFYQSRTRGTYQVWCKECQKEISRSKSKKKVQSQANNVTDGVFSETISKLVEAGKKQEEKKNEEVKHIRKTVSEELTLNQLVNKIKKDKEFNLKDWFTPRELINALYDLGYRGELSIWIEHKVRMSHEEKE